MKLWKLALIALFATLAAMACTRDGENGYSSGTAQAIARTTLDGAYMKIYGGKQSFFVFHSNPNGGDTGNVFFAEFEGPNGTMIRADGIFTYGHDDLGNFVELKRKDGSQPTLPSSDNDSGATADAGTPDDEASTTDDAGTDYDAGDMDADDGAYGDDGGGSWDPVVDDAGPPPPDQDAGAADAGSGSSSDGDPTAPVFQRYHYVKTGAHQTILTRDERDSVYQFKMVSSYCGTGAEKDCALQKSCATTWTCTDKHTCSCGN